MYPLLAHLPPPQQRVLESVGGHALLEVKRVAVAGLAQLVRCCFEHGVEAEPLHAVRFGWVHLVDPPLVRLVALFPFVGSQRSGRKPHKKWVGLTTVDNVAVLPSIGFLAWTPPIFGPLIVAPSPPGVV